MHLLFPNHIEVKYTNLMELAATICAGHERFQLQHVVLRGLELFLLHHSAG